MSSEITAFDEIARQISRCAAMPIAEIASVVGLDRLGEIRALAESIQSGMRPVDPDRLRRRLDMLACAYLNLSRVGPAEWNATMAMYISHLKHYPEWALARAISHCAVACKYYPTIAEINEAVKAALAPVMRLRNICTALLARYERHDGDTKFRVIAGGASPSAHAGGQTQT